MEKRKKISKVVALSDFALERDKRTATAELRDYFVEKNNQEKLWHLVTALMNSLRTRLFSSDEAEKITAFLARKFDIRPPAIQSFQAGGLLTHTPNVDQTGRKPVWIKKAGKGDNLFYQLFLRLQAAVQENLLDYNGARSLVRETIFHYPTAKAFLQ